MAVWNVINHTELSSGNATLIDWTSISSSYDNLFVDLSVRGDNSGKIVSYYVQFNGETSSTNYSYTNFYLTGTTVGVEKYTNQATVAAYPRMVAGTGTANMFSGFQMWVPNYSNTSHFKPILATNPAASNSATSGEFYYYEIAGMWANTDAVDQITITASSDDFVQYSSATLYGINGAA